ncbi:MAG: hypothetical protein Q7K45_05080 [Nanoarchaeota archaeon]|nr:hypothetical protein [Nanoarchaeota archaeon]
MMQSLTILNTREVKKIKEVLVSQFGYALQEDYAYLKNDKDKIFLVNKDAAKLDWKKLIIDKMGLYFAEDKETEIRLSKEGAQLLASEAKKNKQKLMNVVELSTEETKTYFQGQDLPKDLGADSKNIILQYKHNILGCAKYKEGKILNFLPKTYRGEAIL